MYTELGGKQNSWIDEKTGNLRKKVVRSSVVSFFIFFIFLQLYCPKGISPIGNSGCSPQGKPAATGSRYPAYGACWVFQCFYNPPNSDMVFRVFNVRTDVNACYCTRGDVRTHVRESALKVDSGRKIPCRTGESNLRQRGDGPMLYQLSYISAPEYMSTSGYMNM